MTSEHGSQEKLEEAEEKKTHIEEQEAWGIVDGILLGLQVSAGPRPKGLPCHDYA